MRVSSDIFDGIVSGSHLLVTRVDVLFNREVRVEGLPLVDGTVNYDRTAARLARFQGTFADPLRLPLDSSDIYTPFGYELRIWRGVGVDPGNGDYLYYDGEQLFFNGEALTLGNPEATIELVALGTFPIQSSFIDGVSLVTDVTCEDRSRLVSDARFEDDYQVAAGTNYADAIEALVAAGVDGLEYLFPSTTFTTPLLTFAAQSDRWEAAQGMARAIGMELFFDGLGRLTMRPTPTFADNPVKVIREGEGGNLVAVGIELDRTEAYNRVIAFSSNAAVDPPVRGVATDSDPFSPTYYDGPFGQKPRFYSSPFIVTQEQADSAAAAILADELGVASGLSFSAVPDPRLECGDVVLFQRAVLEVDDAHIVEKLTIGLGPESPMTGTTRVRQAA